MALTEADLQKAEKRMASNRESGHAISVTFSFEASKFTILMNNGLELVVPFSAIKNLRYATQQQAETVEITPSGTGLIWPELDEGLHIPSLLLSVAGTKNWIAKTLGASGGKTRTTVKSIAARENGKKGGRPKKPIAA